MHIFRYNEVLLNFAEALNEYDGPTQEVYDAVNAIRERVVAARAVQTARQPMAEYSASTSSSPPGWRAH